MPENHLVLVVDDDSADLALMKRILTKNDYRVKTAQTAREALEILEECKPAMVLLDIGLPGMSGLELCTVIKSHEALQHIPVVFLSGRDSPDDYRTGREAGSVFYVSKHRGFDNIMTVVNTLCAVRKNDKPKSPSAQNRISAVDIVERSEVAGSKRHR